ncbi:RdgB/HAM1 family non-canonical purine NTP pyrophosphatase [Halorubellus sp. JP-L1]|uniref:RdgB/HAM1 family non-canonical purine NTP pyrophosphatase n=1 Tax=Halorubellus sp. JP-L1 TaxID=2715753 RepID=UPI00140D8CC4|nr:RdgB/HAM1 family non-canonical purine NTP pyrophosphatase [Halorubellus sp. JP-L1]NHN42070.1 RdgB/HAM1 family non-canonical purine NTP pyrophosphatase [Halorubellus sp. JP-L1]
MPIRFVTSNEGKAEEAREYLDDVERVDFDYTEIQGDLESVAAAGAREAFVELGGTDPVLVDDAGLFVRALVGFPGPYSSYVEDTLGVERVWRLCEREDDRRAHFRTVLAYAHRPEDALDVKVETFTGSVPGTIVEPRGDGGFGYDPIFEHDGTTMAEMSTAEKNAVSHRGRALAKFADYLAGEPAQTKGAE